MIILKVSKNTAYGIFPPLGKLQRSPNNEDRLKLGFNFISLKG